MSSNRIFPSAIEFVQRFTKIFATGLTVKNEILWKNFKEIIDFLSRRPTTQSERDRLRILMKRLPIQYPRHNSCFFPWDWVIEPKAIFDQNLRFLTLLHYMGFFGTIFSVEAEVSIFPDFSRFYRSWIYEHLSLAWPEDYEDHPSEQSVSEKSFAEEFPNLAQIGFGLEQVSKGWGYTSTRSWGQNYRNMNYMALVISSIGPFWDSTQWNGDWEKYAVAFNRTPMYDFLFIEPKDKILPVEVNNFNFPDFLNPEDCIRFDDLRCMVRNLVGT